MSVNTLSDPVANNWWDKLVVSLELADLDDLPTRERLDSAAAKANNQGIHLAASWQYARALPMLTAAIDVWTRLEQFGGVIHARNVRGGVYRKIGSYPAAQSDYREALALATLHDVPGAAPGAIAARIGMALTLLAEGDHIAAEGWANDALQHSNTVDDPIGGAYAQHALARIHETRKDWDAARSAYDAAREGYATLSAPAEQVEAITGLARVALGSGHTLDAVTLAEQTLQYLAENGPARLHDPLDIYWTLYRIMHTARDAENAHEVLRAAHMLMLRQMEGLSPEQREQFRTGVTLHRQIAERWTEILVSEPQHDSDGGAGLPSEAEG